MLDELPEMRCGGCGLSTEEIARDHPGRQPSILAVGPGRCLCDACRNPTPGHPAAQSPPRPAMMVAAEEDHANHACDGCGRARDRLAAEGEPDPEVRKEPSQGRWLCMPCFRSPARSGPGRRGY